MSKEIKVSDTAASWIRERQGKDVRLATLVDINRIIRRINDI